jgi:hypothetical protein
MYSSLEDIGVLDAYFVLSALERSFAKDYKIVLNYLGGFRSAYSFAVEDI